jgi:pSer/pThr/pTyr-binding forkhead associated (FHA) protein
VGHGTASKQAKQSVRVVLQRAGALEDFLCVLEAGGAAPTRIGRDDDCALRIMDRSVSRYHAELRVTEDGDLIVVDTGSLNGTQINDAPVSRRPIHLVLPGDLLRFGYATEYRVLKVIDDPGPRATTGGRAAVHVA